MRQSNAVNVLLVLRFHRATFHLFCGPFAAFGLFAMFVHITDKRWPVLLTAAAAHVIPGAYSAVVLFDITLTAIIYFVQLWFETQPNLYRPFYPLLVESLLCHIVLIDGLVKV